jgi:FtsH-binding integral membrane protein
MSDRPKDDIEDDAARSFCVFERDRALPRPMPWRPLMTDTQSQQKTSVKTPMATKIGFALWGVALLWWFAYYSNWHGAFGLMRLKLMCITGATSECEFFQQQISRISAIPTYYPVFWWAGCVAMIVGLVQGRANTKRAKQ